MLIFIGAVTRIKVKAALVLFCAVHNSFLEENMEETKTHQEKVGGVLFCCLFCMIVC